MTADVGALRQLWRFRPYGQRHLRALSLGLGLRIGELLADLARPWPLAIVVDQVLGRHRWHRSLPGLGNALTGSALSLLTAAAAALLLVTLVSGGLDYLGDRVMNGAGERITAAIRADVFAHLQRLPMTFHDQQAVGELTSRISADTNRIEDGLVDLFSTLLPGLLGIVGYAAVLLAVDRRLGLIAIACAPLVFLVASRYTRLARHAARHRRAAEGNLAGFVAESLHGIRTVHAFGRHDVHDQRFSAFNGTTLQAGLRSVELRARFTPLLELTTAAGTAVLLWVGGFGVLNHWWTAGLLIVVVSYLNNMLKPMRGLSRLSITLSQATVSAERVRAILDEALPTAMPPRPVPARASGRIELQDVDFDYGRGLVLDGIDITVHAGERIVLMGPNGAGKSTVLALIAGLYHPTRGELLIDGRPLTAQSRECLHRQIAVVLQDTFLFSGTIADNIRYARPEAADGDVSRAADAALVTEFAARLPDGLTTPLGDHGIGLSGGQRQRIGIARALLLDAPIVLLDEPTAGLDKEAEELVVAALTRLMDHRTVVMTTHRPALVKLATRVVHLHNGALRYVTSDGLPGTVTSRGPCSDRRTARSTG